ncbi:MAG: TlyA family RNA methyltransferase [Deltaproteobacteria bacterium]|nr:TlyA family RNA methyltransferase [Deltaproteobacteria bacterium]
MVQQGIAETREKAKALIMAGIVEVNKIPAEKPGQVFPSTSRITLKKPYPPYVSRGGLKLEAALDAFSIPIEDRTFLDIGASTGGFTDCLLQRGARKVITVDVGYGQLHWRLRQDPRVVILEKKNARYLTQEDIPVPFHGAVIDVSFISLKQIIPPVTTVLLPNALIVALIKPQFEVGKGLVGKGGVVRDPLLHEKVVEEIAGFCKDLGWDIIGCIPSPILGPKGNKEFLMYMTRQQHPVSSI